MKKTLLLIVVLFFGRNVFGQITPPGPIPLCLGDTIVLTAPVGTTYQWFKNGSNLIGDTLQTYTANAAGNYTVKVDVGAATAPVVVNINPKPAIPSFTFTYTPFQCSELPVNFNVTSPVGGITYTWNFGDGQTATGPNVTHTYNALGNGTQPFNVTVTATNSFNCSAVSTGQVINLKQHPDASIADFQSQTPFTNCGTPTFDLTVDNISTTQSTNAQYQIDWGDGSPLFTTAILPLTGTLHTYTTQGYFYLVLKITGQNGCISTKTYTVFNGSNPGVGLSSNGNTVLQCLPATDTFFITYPATNPPGTTYTISYNDGSPDAVYTHPPPSSFTHTFTTSSCGAVNTANPNSFYVKIRAQNPCGYLDGGVEPITTITRPSAAIGISPDTVNCINTTVYFTNTSSNGQVVQNGVCNSGGIINWIITPITGSPTGWTVTSGTIGNSNPNTNPATWGSSTIGVDFNAIGTYSIKIIVRNFSAVGTTCRMDSITRIVCISTLPTTGFKLNKNKGCLPLSINATDTSTFLNNCRALRYLWKVYYSPANCGIDSSWSFTGGTSDTSKNPKFIFKKAGLYTIEQTVISPCGNLTNTKDINVFKSPTFTLPPDTTSCGPTKYDPWVILPGCDTLTLSYSWTFDGFPVSSILPNPDTVLFTGFGSHPIILTATNACGIAKDTQLVIINDIPDVLPNKDTTVCPGTTLGPIVFSSSAAGAVFNWTNSNPAIGLSASGNGDIPLFTATNATASADTGIIIVFSTIPNCGTSLPDTFLIIVKPTITDTTRDTICNNQLPYLWRGITYNSAGTYTVNIINAAGCDTLATLILEVINPQPGFTTVTICPAQIPYVWNGTNYSATGIYPKTLLTPAGCDSSATLNLTISDTIISDIFISICTKDTPYVWNGRTYTSTTTDSIHLKNALNCDSIAYLHLTVNVPTFSTTNSSTCSNLLPFKWNNKDYYIAGTYKDTLLNAANCDSIATLVLTIYDTTSSNTDTSICPSQLPFSWNGNTYSFAIVDSVTLPNSNGCDSIARLFLRVKDTTSSITIDSVCSNKYPYFWNGNIYPGPGTYNAVLVNSQGCDSTAVLILISKPTSTSTTRKTVCRNQLPFVWNSKNYTASGTYRDTLVNRFGCDSIARLILTVTDTSESIVVISICPSQLPYSWNGNVFSTGGFYLDSFVNAAGCDSIAKLQLIIKDTSSSLTKVSICPPQVPYRWNGNDYIASGLYDVTFPNAVGCDSIARLELVVKDSSSSATNLSVCRGNLPFLWNGISISLAGNYTKKLVNAVGCDSIATLFLSINNATTSTNTITICQSQLPYSWNGNIYNGSVTDSVKYTGGNGCDSVVKLVLTVRPNSSSSTDSSICASSYPFAWNGNIYDTAGTYTVVLKNVYGCDSLALLVLKTIPVTRSTTTVGVCSNQFPYLWHGKPYNAAGVYLDTLVNAANCDSVTTLVLNVIQTSRSVTQVSLCPSQFPFTWNGNTYALPKIDSVTLGNARGCDSVAVLILTKKSADSSITNVNICGNQFPFNWNGNNYNTPGIYQVLLTNAQGCDSIARLNLTKTDTTTSSTNIAVCSNQLPFNWNGTDYYLPGTYDYNTSNSNGCDSVAYLQLVVNDTSVSSTTVRLCPSQLPYTWNGNLYNNAGQFSVKLPNSVGCDSVATLVLLLKDVSSSQTVVNICPSQLPYTWNGNIYTTGGSYKDTLINAVGCDSIVTLLLNVKNNSSSISNVSVCKKQLPYLWNGNPYSQAGTYQDTIPNSAGCDSVMTLNLVVKPDTSSMTTVKICPSQLPYQWNGKTYTGAKVDSVLFAAANGCDSVAHLNLIIKDTTGSVTDISICSNTYPFVWNGNTYNGPGSYTVRLVNSLGCDSMARLILRSIPISRTTDTASVCSNKLPYTWHGNVYTTSGIYYDTLVNANGCDSIVKLVINIKPISFSTTQINICPSQLPYTWNGNIYTTGGSYKDTLINAFGCDSIVTLLLNVKNNSSSSSTVRVCKKQLPYLWNGTPYSQAGTYQDTIPNSAGCDSVMTLNLVVKPDTSSMTTVKICPSQLPYQWNGKTYTGAKVDSVLFAAANGCDSVAHLNLIIKDTTGSLTDSSICSNTYPFVWNGNTYNTPGSYAVRLVNSQGCDSMARLILRSIPISRTTDTANACSNKLPYIWHGNVYTTSGIFYDTLVSSRGCDSIIKLVIILKPISFSTTQINICPSQLPYTWNGNVYTTGGSFKDTLINAVNCDSIVTLLLNVKNNSSSTINVNLCKKQLPYLWNGNPYSQAGTYQDTIPNSAGCDSVMTLNLVVKPDTSSMTTVKICPSQLPYQWNGRTYTGAKVDSLLFPAANGCDSVAHLNLIIKDTTGSVTYRSICSNTYPFVWNGSTYNGPGVYTVRLVNLQGCDSMARLVLSTKLITRSTETAGTCFFPYVWHGQTYNNAGTYYDTLQNLAGCDSIVKLILVTTSPTSSVTQLTICSNLLPYSWNTIICTTPGIYRDTIPNTAGCDSTMTLYLTTKPATQSNTTITICPLQLPYSWNGVVYAAGGIDTVPLVNQAGCDSLAIINLIVKSPLRDSVTARTCTNQLPYFWNGNFYFLTGYYSDTLKNTAGCDSIATLQLIVNPTSASDTYDTVCRNQLPYLWNGNSYNATGIFTFTLSNGFGCDSVAKLHLKVFEIDTTVVYYIVCQSQLPFAWNGNTYNTAGTYQAVLNGANSCDSVAKLVLSITPNPPSPNGTSNSAVCEGTSLTLFSQTIPGALYSWSGPDAFRSSAQNPIVTNVTMVNAGNYYVTATVNNCNTSDTVLVSVIPKSIGGNTNRDSAVCSGNNTGTIYLTGNTGIVANWDSSTNNGVSWTSIANASSSITYNNVVANTWYRAVVKTGSCPAVYSDTTKISIVPNASVANAGPDQKLCNLPVATLSANNSVVGAGKWFQFSGPSPAVFTNPNLYNTTVTGLQTNSTYRFVWTITSPGSCNNNSDTVNIVIRPKITTANAGSDQTVCNFPSTSSVTLSANQTPGRPYESGLWSLLFQPTFSIATLVNPSNPSSAFSFNKPGTYKLIWTIGNDALSCPASKDTVVINVYDKPVANFRASPTQFCLGQPDTVFNNSLHANAYEWSWGDGTTSTFVSGQHLYQTAGTFTITLVAKYVDALATCTDTTKRQIVVINKIRAQMNVAAAKPCVPYQLVANAVNTTGAASIQWKIFDHNNLPGVFYATGSSVSHIYNFAGSDSIRLIVYSTNGCADSTTYKFTVYDVPVTVSQPFNIIKTCSHDTTIKFTATTSYSGSDPLNYQWFIDSSLSGNVNPFIHRFITPLDSTNTVRYNISVVADNIGRCGDTSFQGSVLILPLPPISIKVSPSLIQQQPDYTFSFSDTSAYDSLMLYQWNMGDKNLQTRDGKSLSYAYSDTGRYKVRLQKTNLATGCQATDSVRVRILPVPGYLQIPNAICPGCYENALRKFLPLGKGLKEYHLRIYNKWGQKIFETSALNADGSPKEAWDGRWAVENATGDRLQQNAYTWQAEGLYINGTEWKGMVYPDNARPVKTGFITIIR